MYTHFFIKLFFNQLTSKESTDSYDEGTKHHAKRGWPASSKAVDAKDGEGVCRELDGGHGHEGEVELKVQVGDVSDADIEDACDQHELYGAEDCDLPHVGVSEEVQVWIAGQLTECILYFLFVIEQKSM